jgi:hypothetical protein
VATGLPNAKLTTLARGSILSGLVTVTGSKRFSVLLLREASVLDAMNREHLADVAEISIRQAIPNPIVLTGTKTLILPKIQDVVSEKHI